MTFKHVPLPRIGTPEVVFREHSIDYDQGVSVRCDYKPHPDGPVFKAGMAWTARFSDRTTFVTRDEYAARRRDCQLGAFANVERQVHEHIAVTAPWPT